MNLLSFLRSLALLLALVAALSSSAKAQTALPQHDATTLVVYWQGYDTAAQEAAQQTFAPVFSYRTLAAFNRVMADMFRFNPAFYSLYAIAYFEGRVSAFDQLADLAGEPSL